MSFPEIDEMLLQRVFLASRFVAQNCERHPEWLSDGLFVTRRAEGELMRLVLTACAGQTDDVVLRELRQWREREMTRIAFRDLAGWAVLDETLHDLSDFADAACEAALRHAEKTLQSRCGVPRDAEGQEVRPVILGMGKLGGRELNFSSDIDLIFCYTAGGETDGARTLSNEEYFAKLMQEFTRLLTQRTEHGFVYRVDWMLRPFGSAGPPASSFDSLELYYQTHGREWERYALVKARPIAGDLAAGEQLLKNLRPFVYRRYLDYNAIGNLRELKRMIEDEVRRKNLHDNIKLGDGGIREVEFIVQAIQLIRGGQDARLRDNQLRRTLRKLGESQRLEAETVTALDEAYVFLRRAENALQMYADEQMHALPQEEERRAALCAALELPDWAALMQQLTQVRRRVRREFESVFGEPDAPRRESGLQETLKSFWHGHLEVPAALDALRTQGYTQTPEAIIESIDSLKRSRLVRLMREESVGKLLQLLDALLAEARDYPPSETTLLRALQVVHAVSGRATYLTLLRENAVPRAQLLTLCAASPWLTDLLASSPALLDALLDPRALVRPPARQEMEAELDRLCADVTPADTERGMDILRRYQKDTTLRVAAADLLHQLPLVKVSDHLTWLAETILQKALNLAWAELKDLHGEPRQADGQPVAVAAIAYGKFGGLEMSYGSDLDLVFLHDCDALDGDTAGGGRAIANETWLMRYVQRVVNWLSAQTHLGRAYEVDLELRPDGRRGLVITSIKSFETYQQQSAWTWEHQALTRARPAAGDADLGQRFQRIRAGVLNRQRDVGKLRQDILDMRVKMSANLDKTKDGRWDIKQGRGGLIDAEFLTQYLVLRDAHRDAGIVEWSDNWRQLDALERAGSVTAEQKASLIEIYRLYRSWAHARALQNEAALADDSLFKAERETITAIWKQIFEGAE